MGCVDGSPAVLGVQYVIRTHEEAHHDYRGYAGTLASGVLRPGDDVVALPSGVTTQVAAIDGPDGPLEEAFAPMSVVISLTDDVDLGRGDLLARPQNQPKPVQDLEAMVCWMADAAPLRDGREYVLKHTRAPRACAS